MIILSFEKKRSWWAVRHSGCLLFFFLLLLFSSFPSRHKHTAFGSVVLCSVPQERCIDLQSALSKYEDSVSWPFIIIICAEQRHSQGPFPPGTFTGISSEMKTMYRGFRNRFLWSEQSKRSVWPVSLLAVSSLLSFLFFFGNSCTRIISHNKTRLFYSEC